MFTKRASRRLLVAAALAVAAGTAVAVTGVAGATASTSPLPGLNAPGLHAQAVTAEATPTAAPSSSQQIAKKFLPKCDFSHTWPRPGRPKFVQGTSRHR